MAGSINKAIILGNVGKDPEIRGGRNGGREVASFGVATSERWKDRETGERKELKTWHNIVVFDERLVDVVKRYVKKGSKVYIEGQMKTREYQDQYGNKRFAFEVVLQSFRGDIQLLDKSEGSGRPPPAEEDDYGGRPSGGGRGYDTPPQGEQRSFGRESAGGTGRSQREIDDDIPF